MIFRNVIGTLPTAASVKSNARIPQIASSKFKIDWDSLQAINDDLRVYDALYFEDQTQITAVIYSPKILKEIGINGTTIEVQLMDQLLLQLHMAEHRLAPALIGIHEKRIGVIDKEIYVLARKPTGIRLREFLKCNGGLIGIPFLAKSAGLAHVVSLWGRQILELLNFVHQQGYVLRTLNANSVFVSEDGTRVMIESLRGAAQHNFQGEICEAPVERRVIFR